METAIIIQALTLTAALSLPVQAPSWQVERDRFPPREIARQAMQFNRAYRLHVQGRQMMEIHNWWYWQEVLNDTDYLYHAWDWLHAAQGGEGRDETYWQVSLKRLRELIGDDAYNAGTMPPNVPPWRFYFVR